MRRTSCGRERTSQDERVLEHCMHTSIVVPLDGSVCINRPRRASSMPPPSITPTSSPSRHTGVAPYRDSYTGALPTRSYEAQQWRLWCIIRPTSGASRSMRARRRRRRLDADAGRAVHRGSSTSSSLRRRAASCATCRLPGECAPAPREHQHQKVLRRDRGRQHLAHDGAIWHAHRSVVTIDILRRRIRIAEDIDLEFCAGDVHTRAGHGPRASVARLR